MAGKLYNELPTHIKQAESPDSFTTLRPEQKQTVCRWHFNSLRPSDVYMR